MQTENVMEMDELELDGKFDQPIVLGVQGPPGPQGNHGKPGADGEDGGYYTPAVTQLDEDTIQFAFTPSKPDMPAVAPVTVELPAGQGSGGNVDLTGYATEQYVKDYAQPKGEYLTAVPEGYAKTEDIPTDEHIIDLIEENAPESSGGGIAVTGAKVGQTVKIAEVDENGVPTAWESVDFPSGGGGEKLRFITSVTTEEDLSNFEFSEDSEGNPFSFSRIAIRMELQGVNSKSANVFLTTNLGNFTPGSLPISGTSKQTFCCMAEVMDDGGLLPAWTSPIVGIGTAYFNVRDTKSNGNGDERITSVGLTTYQGVLAGAKITVWGC